MKKEIVRVAKRNVADVVDMWRWKKWVRERVEEDATVGKAKVAEDWAVWVEWQWHHKQLPQLQQLGYGLWIVETMVSRGQSSAWAGMAAQMEIRRQHSGQQPTGSRHH